MIGILTGIVIGISVDNIGIDIVGGGRPGGGGVASSSAGAGVG
jgi:hypothetical protein